MPPTEGTSQPGLAEPSTDLVLQVTWYLMEVRGWHRAPELRRMDAVPLAAGEREMHPGQKLVQATPGQGSLQPALCLEGILAERKRCRPRCQQA